MKVLFAILGFVLVVSQAALADEELANKLKPFEAFSPYKWTQWIAMRPSTRPVAAAAVAFAPQSDLPYPYSAPEDSAEDDDEDDDDEEFDDLDRTSAFASWFKRAILPQPPPAPETKKAKAEKADKADKKSKSSVTTTKKPSIVDLPADFWGPPPSLAPNVTLPAPPGYYAAKKSMFISKLFAALAASVLNATVAPPVVPVSPAPAAAPRATVAPATVAPTTISQRQAILDEISEILLSDVARSAPAYPEDTTTEPEEFDDSDENSESDEEPNNAPSKKIKPTTVNPFLLSQIDFLAKLTEAIAATQTKPTAAPTTTTPKPRPTKPTTTEAPKGKKGAKAKKSSKKLAKTPAYMKWIPTTTTPSPTEAPPAVPEIDYAALAKALLGNAV